MTNFIGFVCRFCCFRKSGLHSAQRYAKKRTSRTSWRGKNAQAADRAAVWTSGPLGACGGLWRSSGSPVRFRGRRTGIMGRPTERTSRLTEITGRAIKSVSRREICISRRELYVSRREFYISRREIDFCGSDRIFWQPAQVNG